MVIIDDGKGTGKKAEINLNNQMRVRATSHDEEHFATSTDEQSYQVSSSQEPGVPSLTFANTNVGDVMNIKNIGTIDLIITSIVASADAAGGVLSIYKNKVTDTLTQNIPVTPTNLNFGSAKTSTTEVDIWDETNGDGIQGLTGGDLMRSEVIGTNEVIVTNGAVLIPQGKSLTINYSNNTGSAIEFECGLRYYFDTSISI